MTIQKTGSSFVCAAIGACLLLAIAPTAAAERAAWDQARVTALGQELAKATDELYTSYIKIPPAVVGTRDQSAYELRSKLRLLKNQARSLSEALKSGEGYEQTRHDWENYNMLRRDARDDARMMGFVPDDVLAKADKARDVSLRLTPYYDEDWQGPAPAAR